ncbi:MAG: energy transducer TonB, partial [Candidatus Omnitrophica bacterium]|nr:energy transducer TonB [Candidatus Omnitrophota bacterium]
IGEEKKLKKIEPKLEEKIEIKETIADVGPKKEEVEVEDAHDEAMFRYKDAIKQKIELHRRYPRSARRHKLEGNTTVEFIVMSSGNAHSVRMLNSSGYTVLDGEAMAMVKRASPFLPIPTKFKLSEFRMEVTIIFNLQ